MELIEPKSDRSLLDVRKELWHLHRQVGTLATDVVRMRPSWRLAFRRTPITTVEERLAGCFAYFMNLDADLNAHASPPSDLSTAIRSAAQFQMHFGVRDSVRGLLGATNDAVGSLQNQLDFRLSLAVALFAAVISVAGVVFQIAE